MGERASRFYGGMMKQYFAFDPREAIRAEWRSR